MNTKLTRQRGFSVFGLIFLIILFILIIMIVVGTYNVAAAKCVGDDIISCIFDKFFGEPKEEAKAEGAVTASGALSGKFKDKEGSVTVTLTFPLEGGTVTGTFSGDCDGNIKGSYAGGDGGAISGEAKGSCAFIIPASGEFSGTVNQTSKTVVVSGSGSAAGFSKQGSMTLSY